jgi:hypothetical protein
MWRIVGLGVLGAALLAGRPTAVQAQPSKEEFRRIESELEKLRGYVKELEARLKQGQPETPERKGPGGPPFGKKKEGPAGETPPFAKKKDGKGPWGDGPPFAKKDGKGPWAKDGPPFARMEKKDPPPVAKKDGPGRGGPPWAGMGPGRGFGGGSPWARMEEGRRGGPGRSSDLERRLDRILEELEDIRRELRRR